MGRSRLAGCRHDSGRGHGGPSRTSDRSAESGATVTRLQAINLPTRAAQIRCYATDTPSTGTVSSSVLRFDVAEIVSLHGTPGLLEFSDSAADGTLIRFLRAGRYHARLGIVGQAGAGPIIYGLRQAPLDGPAYAGTPIVNSAAPDILSAGSRVAPSENWTEELNADIAVYPSDLESLALPGCILQALATNGAGGPGALLFNAYLFVTYMGRIDPSEQ
jgi:hypothetical protein